MQTCFTSGNGYYSGNHDMYDGTLGVSLGDHQKYSKLTIKFNQGSYDSDNWTVKLKVYTENGGTKINQTLLTNTYDLEDSYFTDVIEITDLDDLTENNIYIKVDFDYNEITILRHWRTSWMTIDVEYVTYSCDSGYDFPSTTDNTCSPICYGTIGDSQCNYGSCVNPDDCLCDTNYWGIQCNSTCPVFTSSNGSEDTCSISSARGDSCDSTNHVCVCKDDFLGDVCQYVKFTDSDLESYICSLGSVTCTDGHVPFYELENLTTLDLSSQTNISSLRGLQYAPNLTSINLSRPSFSPGVTYDLVFLSDLNNLTSVSLDNNDLSSTSTPPGATNLSYLPLSINYFSLNNVNLFSTASFSSFTVLTTLLAANNASFAPSVASFPNSLRTLDISGISMTSPSILPSYLTSITANNVGLAENADFSSFSSLSILSISGNDSFGYSQTGILPASLTSLSLNSSGIHLLHYLVQDTPNIVTLDLSGNYISDPSPLYDLSELSDLDLSDNMICGSGLDSILSSGTIDTSSNSCECSAIASTALSSNKVCLETIPGSESWYVVCASDSYALYDASRNMTCVKASHSTTNCSGGCEYGQECRLRSDIGSTAGECKSVIVDSTLRTLSSNKVCLETIPGSESWYVVCASDSYALYDASRNMTCVKASHSTTNCSGGCEYGQECRLRSDIGSTAGECKSVIVDSTLRSYVALESGIILTSDKSSDAVPVFSVASLKSIDFSNAIISLDGASTSITTVEGLEHIDVKEVILTNHTNLSDVSLFSSYTNIIVLDISGCSLVSSLPTLSQSSSLTELNVSATNITSLSPVIDQASTLESLDMHNCDLSGVTDRSVLFDSFVELTTLNINSTGISDLSWLSNNTQLTELYADSCGIDDYDLIHLTALPLEVLSLVSNSIGDPSPLYALSDTLADLDLTSNNICELSSADLASHFLANLGTSATVICDSQDCLCDPFDTAHALAENIVCTQTKSGSNTWFAVCASDSFTTYSSASSISCVRATASSNNCIGGCAYGYECRSLSDSSTSGHCVEVIADDALHSCVEDLFEANSDHADDTVSPVLFSVASLKTLVTGFDDTPVLSCSDANVSDLAG
ncbi:hypothetical protein ADUPG1_000501, partial [Aduncisulcus paluster]